MKKILMTASLVAAMFGLASCEGDFWSSNRCTMLDRNHTFTRASVFYGASNVVYEVVAWMDYENSDTIQLWVKDEASPKGHKVILTHYSRVVLENPNPAYDPKF